MSTVPLSEAKAKLARFLTEVDQLGERVVVTGSGRPVGVLLPVDEYGGLLETLEILADPELPSAVRRGLADAEAGALVEHADLWPEAGDLEASLRR